MSARARACSRPTVSTTTSPHPARLLALTCVCPPTAGPSAGSYRPRTGCGGRAASAQNVDRLRAQC